MVRVSSATFLSAAAFGAMLLHSIFAFTPSSSRISEEVTHSPMSTQLFGWFDSLFPQLNDVEAGEERKRQFPEQYPATYEMSSVQVPTDSKEAALLRPLLKQTQLQERPLVLAYDASKHGWSAQSFHNHVDGKGAAIVLATTGKLTLGGYNPKGWASMGGARPSVAAFLFYSSHNGSFQKPQKVGGGGLACGRDDPTFGISFGPDALVIGLQPGRERSASSKLGPYYERGPEDRSSLFDSPGQAIPLDSLKVCVGKYQPGEEIPYRGAVMDMTSG